MHSALRRLPGWFCTLFVIVMIALCALLAAFAVEQQQLRFQIEDLSVKLETSRQREAKQTYEYDQVVAELPLVKAELERVQPLADAAMAEEDRLRKERKELRAAVSALEEQIAQRQAELDELTAQAQALQEIFSPLNTLLTPVP